MINRTIITRRFSSQYGNGKPWSELLNWGVANEIKIHPHVNIVYRPGIGLDLVAQNTCHNKDVLVSIGRKSWYPFSAEFATKELITRHEPVHEGLMAIAKQLMPNQPQGAHKLVQSLSLAVILLLNLHADHPYPKLLLETSIFNEDSLPHPLRMDPSQLLTPFLSGTKVLDDILKRQRLYQHISSTATPLLQHLLRLESGDHNLPDQLLWTLGIILSRGLSGAEFPFSLVPILDFANHSDMAVNACHRFESDCFQLVANREISSKESICIDYGSARDSSSFLTLYGFLGGQRSKSIDQHTKQVFSYNSFDRLPIQLPTAPLDHQSAVRDFLYAKYSTLIRSNDLDIQVSKQGLVISLSYRALLEPQSSAFAEALSCLLISADLFLNPQAMLAQIDTSASVSPTSIKEQAVSLRKVIEGHLADPSFETIRHSFFPSMTISSPENLLEAFDHHPSGNNSGSAASEVASWEMWVTACKAVQANRLRALLNLKSAL